MKQIDISDTLRFIHNSDVSRIKNSSRKISVSQALAIKQILGGELEEYLHKTGDEGFQILQRAASAKKVLAA